MSVRLGQEIQEVPRIILILNPDFKSVLSVAKTDMEYAVAISVSEFLTDHQSAHPAVHDANPDTAELRSQNVCTMSGRVH